MSKHTAATFLGMLVARMRDAFSPLWWLEARFKGVEFQGRATFLGRPLISVAPGGRIVLGDGVRVSSAERSNPLGAAQPAVLRALAPGAQLILGPGVGLSSTVLCAGASIEIGEHTILGAGAMVLDNDFHKPTGEWDWALDYTSRARPVRIGRGVFIGTRAIVLKGVTIGDRAIIGAGAVVVKDVPANHIAIGNPARVFANRRPSSGSAGGA